MNKLLYIAITAVAVLSFSGCRSKVVTDERWQRDTVTVESVREVTQYQRDTVTITEHTEATVERVRVDTVGRPVVFERIVYRNAGTTSAGTVQREIVHDTITIKQGSTSTEKTKQKTPTGTAAPWLLLMLAGSLAILFYVIYKFVATGTV